MADETIDDVLVDADERAAHALDGARRRAAAARSASPRSSCSATTTRRCSAMRSTPPPGARTAEGHVLAIDDYELISCGWTNPTPWDMPREMPEEELGAKLDELFAQLPRPRHARSSTRTRRPMTPDLTTRRCSIPISPCSRAPGRSSSARSAAPRSARRSSATSRWSDSTAMSTSRPAFGGSVGRWRQPRQRLRDRLAQRSAHHPVRRQAEVPSAGPGLMATADALLVAVDAGTTGARAVAVDDDGHVVHESRRPYATATPQPGWAEQNPSDWREMALAAVGDLVRVLGGPVAGERIAAIGLTGQCPTVAPFDGAGTPVGPGMMYRDNRASAEARRDARADRRGGDARAHRPPRGRLPRRAEGALAARAPPGCVRGGRRASSSRATSCCAR